MQLNEKILTVEYGRFCFQATRNNSCKQLTEQIHVCTTHTKKAMRNPDRIFPVFIYALYYKSKKVQTTVDIKLHLLRLCIVNVGNRTKHDVASTLLLSNNYFF
jgi:hypothetical protein